MVKKQLKMSTNKYAQLGFLGRTKLSYAKGSMVCNKITFLLGIRNGVM